MKRFSMRKMQTTEKIFKKFFKKNEARGKKVPAGGAIAVKRFF